MQGAFLNQKYLPFDSECNIQYNFFIRGAIGAALLFVKFAFAENIPAELRTRLRPDLDNTSGGRI